jgi:cytochrome c553
MPAKSKSQQRLFGMVHAYKNGKLKKAPAKIKEIAKNISDDDARDFAKTKSKGLPEKKASPLDFMFVSGFLSRMSEMRSQ